METRPLVESNTAFALDLYREVKATDGNLFCSPFSISAALAMTFAGARGDTAAQMARTLHFDPPHDAIPAAFAQLRAGLATLEESGRVRLMLANALWPQAGYGFLNEFLALVREHFHASVTAVDYTAWEAAADAINAWVSDQTDSMIGNLIAPERLNALTRLVLVNAVYFQGLWEYPFPRESTKSAPFETGTGETADVPMMSRRGDFAYGERESLQILELPYAGDRLSMVVFLPGNRNALADLESSLTVDTVNRWMASTRRREVDVYLPRFRIEGHFSLESTLKALGMRDAFDMDRADFSGMDGRERWLYISAAFHQAVVDVHEEGTEAAGAAAVIMAVRSPIQPTKFRADHPFVFLIRDNETGSLLFLGRLVDPR